MRWYRKAADQGNAIAENFVGLSYENGLGVKKDLSEAMRWYRKAADQGNAEAENSIGYLYAHGLSVEQSLFEAMKWYRKAADQGMRWRKGTLPICTSIAWALRRTTRKRCIGI